MFEICSADREGPKATHITNNRSIEAFAARDLHGQARNYCFGL
jgi:hypothetical protein